MQTPRINASAFEAVPMDGFQKGWEAGMQRKREEELKRVMGALAANPYDPKAQALAAPHAPQVVIGLKQKAMEQEQQKQQELTKYIGILAQWADTPEKWDQAAQMMVQNGYAEAAQFIGKFSPGLRAHLIAQGGGDPSPRQSQDPSFIREADALGIPRDEAARLWRQKQGIVVINGIPHMTVPGTEQPAPVLRDEDFMEGGGSGDSSTGNFRDPLAPL